ncbi:MAG: SDR family oxidoreductase [Ferruginibacter sp.]
MNFIDNITAEKYNFLTKFTVQFSATMNLSLTNKIALVCGASQGIGLATAQELAKLGATCILLARNEESLQKAVEELSANYNQKHRFFVADFSNTNNVKAVAESIATNYSIHILINNTGGPASGPIIDATEIDFINTFNQHLICNHILTKAFVPSMKKEGFGRIINIISTSVRIPLRNLGVSNTIRGAVASWAKTMANELAQFNITVNNVLPGATKTARLESIIKNNAAKQGMEIENIEEEMKAEIPMKRFGEPREIAAVAAFLASPAAGYVNGVSIAVDGGRTGSL